jgi:hypothetical protein
MKDRSQLTDRLTMSWFPHDYSSRDALRITASLKQ